MGVSVGADVGVTVRVGVVDGSGRTAGGMSCRVLGAVVRGGVLDVGRRVGRDEGAVVSTRVGGVGGGAAAVQHSSF